MSQLESILGQLKKSLADSGVDAAKFRKEEGIQAVDPKAASAALKDFLTKNPISGRKNSEESDDPSLILDRRKKLSVFVGQNLTNNGVPCLSGTIQTPLAGASHGGAHGSGHAAKSANTEKNMHAPAAAAPPPVPFTPAPMPVMQICPSCVTAEASKKAPKVEEKVEAPAPIKAEAQKNIVSTATTTTTGSATSGQPSTAPLASSVSPATVAAPGASHAVAASSGVAASPASNISSSAVMAAPQGMSFSAPQVSSAPSISEPAATNTMPAPKADTAVAKPQSKGGVAGFFANLMPGKKGGNQETESENPAPSTGGSVSKITWFKHIQAIESALLIGDVHFADSLLQLLYETAKSLSAEVNIIARLQSLQAKVLIERRQFADAESSLKDMIQSLQGSTFAKNICTAYCWRALALCYHRQKKTAEAESARKKSIELADAALGAANPEAMLFKEPLI